MKLNDKVNLKSRNQIRLIKKAGKVENLLKKPCPWMDGWMDGWMIVKAVLRIAHSNKNSKVLKLRS